MAWVKVDDNYPHHPKIVKAGAAGMALDIAGMCYSASYLTDGFVPDSAVTTLYPVRSAKTVADLLVTVGRWERDDQHHGYWIHDYLDYNPPADKIIGDREAEREKKRKQRRSPDGTYTSVPGGQEGGHPQGLPPMSPPSVCAGVARVPSRPVPSRPVLGVGYMGESVTSTPLGDPTDDDPRFRQSVEKITDRRMAEYDVEKPRGYRSKVRASVMAEDGGELWDWLSEHLDATTDEAADYFRPAVEAEKIRHLRIAEEAIARVKGETA